ncbi:hypothetical protein PPL_01851 [Heterostelium album PN500]|uniref:Uncharacterized protein n=1 Tax=Heterostelium pallidum (strain ATCC 26659 / Pp 5 / PN500) TaxID=670386 RepID=D3B0N4_HETP5|nr:hypothetical protein PPL_01851 [Heterostelium album PN500]EFA84858.1 hypothetical protein PPL_01851 [Heterostelium album PN500]|eukprot:XP_020436969.1 hypothetical protein PPL_01851 [Heterostelium album PN500]
MYFSSLVVAIEKIFYKDLNSDDSFTPTAKHLQLLELILSQHFGIKWENKHLNKIEGVPDSLQYLIDIYHLKIDVIDSHPGVTRIKKVTTVYLENLSLSFLRLATIGYNRNNQRVSSSKKNIVGAGRYDGLGISYLLKTFNIIPSMKTNKYALSKSLFRRDLFEFGNLVTPERHLKLSSNIEIFKSSLPSLQSLQYIQSINSDFTNIAFQSVDQWTKLETLQFYLVHCSKTIGNTYYRFLIRAMLDAVACGRLDLVRCLDHVQPVVIAKHSASGDSDSIQPLQCSRVYHHSKD